jgi:hypothetical protein
MFIFDSLKVHGDRYDYSIVDYLSSNTKVKIMCKKHGIFDPNTKSPVSLLELGLHAKERKLIVYCPEGFWRKGNVDIVCEAYKVKQVKTFEELLDIFTQPNLKERIRSKKVYE